jgi:LPXTG-motif cell wall-anchored protein
MKLRKLLVSGVIVAGVVGLSTASAMAEDYVGNNNNGSGVLGNDLSRSTGAAPATRGSGLPVTGGDIAGLTIVGLGAVGAGTVLVRRSRRQATTA